MASLSTDLINRFAKTVTEQPNLEEGIIVYGIVTSIASDGTVMVRLDGVSDDTITPVSTAVTVTVGDRVSITVQNHKAIITGNVTGINDTEISSASTSANSRIVNSAKVITDYIKANYVDADYISAHYVTTNYLTTNYLQTGTLDAEYASIAELVANYVKTNNLDAAVANLGYLTADTAVVSGGLTVGQIEAQAAQIGAIGVTSINAASAYIEDLQTNSITVQDISSATGYIGTLTTGNVSANNLVADHGIVGNLSTTYAQIDAANITDANIRNAWVNQIMVQTGLIANQGNIFYLDAVKVNANNITAGTIDVERMIVTDSTTGDKHMVTWNSSTQSWDAVKLDGDVIEDRTITGDKIVANSITANEITTQNIVGTNGWINLASGTFNFNNVSTGTGISWDGQTLRLSGDTVMSSGSHQGKTVDQAMADVEEQVATILRVDSSRGTSFKHNSVSTVLSAVLYHGTNRVENLTDLHSIYGNSAYLQWSWQAYNSSSWTTIANNDSRIGNNGFTLTISDADVNIKSVFQCNLIVPDPAGSTGATGTTS